MKSPREVIGYAKDKGATMVDLRFIDMPGVWQHTTVPIHRLEESSFEDGFGFDGSSIRGYQPINASDMLVIPDSKTAFMDPFTDQPMLVLICDIADPITREPYKRDPRYIAKKAEAYLKQTGIGDTIYFGPEAEFFVFDDVRYDVQNHGSFFEVDSSEGIWNSGRDEGPNLAHKIGYKGGYFPVQPT